jgi:hypothetical protein
MDTKYKVAVLFSQQVAVPAWVPTDLLNLKLWLDKSSTFYQDNEMTTPAAAGDPVGAIADLSGNSNHATQATDGNRMTARAATIKSVNTLSLEGYGANNEYDLPDLFGSSCTSLTMVIVFSMGFAPAAGQGYFWASSNGGLTSSNDYIAARVYSDQFQLVINQAGGVGGLALSSAITLDQNPHVAIVRWDNAKIYLDVDEQHYEENANVGALNLSTNNTLGAAYSAGGYVLPVKGRYYGALAYSRCITDAEVTLIKSYYTSILGTPFNDYYKSAATGLGAAALHDANWQPQIVRLASGRLFVTYTEFFGGHMETDPSIVKTGYSDDDGATWSAGPNIIGDGITNTNNTAGLYLLSNGNLVCVYFRRPAGGGLDAKAYRKISTDGGANWGSEAALGDFLGAGTYEVPYTNGVVLDNDTILQPCYSYGDTVTGPTNRIFIAKSTDGGDTWSMVTMATGDKKSFDPYNENPLARRGNTIVSMVRNETTHTYWYTKSTDLGETWSTPVNTGIGTAQIGFPSLAYDDNMLILVDRTMSPNARVSWDDGATWTLAYLLNDIDGSTNNSYNTSHILVTAGRRYMIYASGGKLRCFVRSSGAWI